MKRREYTYRKVPVDVSTGKSIDARAPSLWMALEYNVGEEENE